MGKLENKRRVSRIVELPGPFVKCPKFDHKGDRVSKVLCQRCTDKQCKKREGCPAWG